MSLPIVPSPLRANADTSARLFTRSLARYALHAARLGAYAAGWCGGAVFLLAYLANAAAEAGLDALRPPR